MSFFRGLIIGGITGAILGLFTATIMIAAHKGDVQGENEKQ